MSAASAAASTRCSDASAGEEDPACPECGGVLRTATVAFGQSFDPDVLGDAIRAARSCAVALAIGTSTTVQPAASLCSTTVQPAASLCSVAASEGASVVVSNEQPTDYDRMADLVVRAGIGATLTTVESLLLDQA